MLSEKNEKKRNMTFVISVVGIMSAISTVIYMLFPEIPIVPGISWMKIDFSDFPALMLGMIMDPAEGLAVGIIKNIFHLLKTDTFGIGEMMNTGVIAAMVFSMKGFSRLFGRVFKKDRFAPLPYFTSAVLSVGITILAGWLLNAVFTPVYFAIMGFPITTESIFLGVTGSTLLNTVKAAFNVLPFYPVYLAADRAYKKFCFKY